MTTQAIAFVSSRNARIHKLSTQLNVQKNSATRIVFSLDITFRMQLINWRKIMTKSTFCLTALALAMFASASQAQQIVLPDNDRVVFSVRDSGATRGSIGGLTTREDETALFAEVTVTLPNGTTIVLKGDKCETDGNTVSCSDN